MLHRRFRTPSLSRFAAVALANAAFAAVAGASTGTITATNTNAGVTPQYIGYNMGHHLPGSNASSWVDYSQVNAFRVWTSPAHYEPVDDIPGFGDGVNSLASFNTRKGNLRANPSDPQYINWAYFDNRFANYVQSGRNKVVLDPLLSDLRARGIDPVVELSRSTAWTMTSWEGKWEQWQHTYAMVYHMAGQYDVSRFQTYNEPDQNSSPVPQAEWLQRLQIASDAVRSAIADVNRDFGKSLVADVWAPVTQQGADKIDTWGKLALENNRTDYQGQTVNYDIFNTFDVHRYDSTGPTFTADLQTFNQKIPQYNPSGQMMPVVYTEWNRQSSSSFQGSSNSLDTPSVFTDIASTYIGAMEGGVTGLYSFKFSQTLWNHDNDSSTPEVPQKTGFHYIETDYAQGGLNNITGATRGAGVVRLASKAFAGARPRLDLGVVTNNTNYDVAASFDPASKNYYVMGVNRNVSTTYDLDFDLSQWDVQPGTVVSIEEVSDRHHGEVTRLVTVPANGRISLSGGAAQPGKSVWLLTVPSGAPQQQVVLNPTQDAQVRNSDAASPEAYKSKNYGAQTTARVGRTDDSARLDHATYMKFNLGGVDPSNINRAILQVTGQSQVLNSSADPGPILFHVYALTDDSWAENTITWENAPDLAGAADAKLTDVGGSAFPVGHLTFDHTLSEWGLDVTDFLQQHGDGQITFALVREQRFDGDLDPSLSFVELFTRESASPPKLTLFVPEPTTGVLLAVGLAGTLLTRTRRRGRRSV